MEIFIDINGRVGIDCGGFCKFCFYKNVNFNNLITLGCKKCSINHIGCDYCQNFIDRVSKNFKPLYKVLAETRAEFFKKLISSNPKNLKIIIGAGADVFSYPNLYELISTIKEHSALLHLGYTSGKPIKDENMVDKMISMGVDIVSFSVFSTDPELRRKWMHDKTAEESIKGLKMFCENIELRTSAVIIPGVNNDEILKTCTDLENWGAKSLTLRRFANYKNQGLILNEKPIIDGINPHSYDEFKDLVQKINNEFSFKVFGYPIFDPENESPFAISKTENVDYLKKLYEIKSDASIITGKLAAPYLKRIFERIDENNFVNIINTDSEIADLIIQEDLETIDLTKLKSKVIIPSGALVHDKIAKKVLCRDNKHRKILRGPYLLTYPYFDGEHLTDKEELIKYELEAFNALINKINS